jgi:hypothetical protein
MVACYALALSQEGNALMSSLPDAQDAREQKTDTRSQSSHLSLVLKTTPHDKLASLKVGSDPAVSASQDYVRSF